MISEIKLFLCKTEENKNNKMYSADSKQAFRFDLNVISVEASLTSSYDKVLELKAEAGYSMCDPRGSFIL